MKLRELVGGDCALNGEEASLEVSGLTVDSRKVQPGFVFFAMPGTKVDGATFVPQAVKHGAAAVVVASDSQVAEAGVPLLRVKDPRLSLSHFAARFYPKQPETIVAVTGTAGKTSVAAFVRQLWARMGYRAASIGTTGVEAPGMNIYGSLTTPDPVDLHRMLDELARNDVSHAAMEASSHGLDQRRLDGVRLAAAGFTNLGRDHLDYHPTMEEYFDAKMRLFTELLPKGAPAVIFSDDAYSAKAIKAAKSAKRDVLTVGRAGEFLALKRVEHERFRQIAEIHMGEKIFRIEFPLAGDFQIANALVAAGMAIASGSDPSGVIYGLEKLKGAPGRLELVGSTADGSPVYVDYAHKPEALENVLASVRPFTTGRIITVFGCGGDRDKGKRPIMGEIATRLSDVVIVTDDNPRTEDAAEVRREIMAAASGATEIGDRREAIHTAIAMLRTGDCLIVAGKGHEEGQIIGETVHPFSDHGVVREGLRERDGDGATIVGQG